METLTGKDYWDARYPGPDPARRRRSLKRRLKDWQKALTRRGPLAYLRRYDDYLLWEVIYRRYMPATKGAKVLEIGSAPGSYLVRLSRTFGYVPYGVEYSESGAELNRRKFLANHFDPGNVIHADFFSADFHRQHRGAFDIVVSRGFIEHFSDPGPVVQRHLDLLAPGGLLFVSIPNFRGVNYFLTWLFQPQLIPLHNFDIMRKERFERLFDARAVERRFCDYYGTFDFGLFEGRRPLLRPVLAACKLMQLPLNVVFRVLFDGKGAESSFFSPYLLFIGRKRA